MHVRNSIENKNYKLSCDSIRLPMSMKTINEIQLSNIYENGFVLSEDIYSTVELDEGRRSVNKNGRGKKIASE